MQRVVWSTIIERCAVRALGPRVRQCVPVCRVWCGPLATAVPAHTGGRWVPCEMIVMRPWRAPATMTTAWWCCCCCRCCYLSFPPDNGGRPAAHGRCVRRYRVVVEVNNLLLNPLPNSPFYTSLHLSSHFEPRKKCTIQEERFGIDVRGKQRSLVMLAPSVLHTLRLVGLYRVVKSFHCYTYQITTVHCPESHPPCSRD